MTRNPSLDPPFGLPEVLALIDLAFAEDLGAFGDVTSATLVPAEARCGAELVAREAGVIAGLELARAVFERRARGLSWDAGVVADGNQVAAGAVLVRLAGPARGILEAERIALNFLGRLSGIATRTRTLVDAAAPLGLEVCDTRKTTPGWRRLEKYAVRCGGGRNHRLGLYDAILVKDNHRALAGKDLASALAGAAWPPGIPLMVEAESEFEVDAAVAAGADLILLDNQGPEDLARLAARARQTSARLGRPRPRLEASGGISAASLAGAAAAGVDRVSVGALTHSAPCLDLALEFLNAP